LSQQLVLPSSSRDPDAAESLLIDVAPSHTQAWPAGGFAQRTGAVTEALAQSDETLVADPRALLSPSQMVERKLIGLLRNGPLPVSQLMTSLIRSHRGLA
jgi:hypothetical protein